MREGRNEIGDAAGVASEGGGADALDGKIFPGVLCGAGTPGWKNFFGATRSCCCGKKEASIYGIIMRNFYARRQKRRGGSRRKTKTSGYDSVGCVVLAAAIGVRGAAGILPRVLSAKIRN